MDENVKQLKSMGFYDEQEIRQALSASNNDINEALSILLNEKLPKINGLTSSATVQTDVEMNEFIGPISSKTSTNDTHINNNNDLSSSETSFHSVSLNELSHNTSGLDSTNLLEFPTDCLYALENSVYSEQWSIPFKKDEWLGKLLLSSIAMLKEDVAENDANCKQFMYNLCPEVYKKLLTSSPVNRWNSEIQSGVYNMTCLFVELVALRLQKTQHGVPESLLHTLALVLNSENDFHVKNLNKSMEKPYFLEKFDNKYENFYSAIMDKYGWLLNMINLFGLHRGYDSIKIYLDTSTNISELNSLLKPIASCITLLNHELIRQMLNAAFDRILNIIINFEGDDFRDKNVNKVFDLLSTMKTITSCLWPHEIIKLHKTHLKVVLDMLKYSHFNAKMNSLKEICKLIELSNALTPLAKTSINDDYLSEWIIENKILSLGVEGNIDQYQYCEKIRNIVEFIGDKITNEEIETLWQMQFNKPMTLVENLYNIIGISASRFSIEQLDFLLVQINRSWENVQFKLHDRLVNLLGLIGRETKSHKIFLKILDALWELKNHANLSRELLLQIYQDHLNVLCTSRIAREVTKKEYLKKCCDDIKSLPGTTISIASLKHIYDILSSYQKTNFKSLKESISDIVTPMMKVICTSLEQTHKNSCEKSAQAHKQLDSSFFIDHVFTHEEAIIAHLHLIKFVLKEGSLYLNLNRAQDIWQILIVNEHACNWDRQVGFDWFIECLVDLNEDSRMEIFKKQILKLNPTSLTTKAYECFKLYFLRVNETESKIAQRSEDNLRFVVEKLDLAGRNFLWDIILYVNDEDIAQQAIKFLLEILYEKVSFRLKKDLQQLHSKFIQECYEKLENCLVTLDSNPIGKLLWNAFRISYLSVNLSDLNSVETLPRSEKLKCIERLLLVAEKYIIAVEESTLTQRFHLPHFKTFKGETFTLLILIDQRKPIELYLNASNDSKLLSNLHIDGMKPLNVKIQSTYFPQTPSKIESFSSLTCSTRLENEQEKCLPGVLMSLNYNGSNSSAFELLHRLEELDEPKIHVRVRNIMKLIPTDPKLLESYDKITHKTSTSTNIVTLNDTGSPVKKSVSSTSLNFAPLTLKRHESSSSIAKQRFDLTQFFNKDLPPNRILYNLEALCSRIAPLSNDTGILQSSDLFQQDFIKSNGMDILISLLKLDKSLNYNDYETKQNILILNLQLLRLIIFGSMHPPIIFTTLDSTLSTSQNKRPSNEPIMGCAKKCLIQSPGGHTSGIGNELNSSLDQASQSPILTLDNAPTNILYRMNLNQINEIISQLLSLVWSSACGNLNLTANSGNNTSGLNKNDGEETVKKVVKFSLTIEHRSSIGSNMSTSSQDDTNDVSLHTGSCMKANSISTKDIRIASKCIEMISYFMQNRRDCISSVIQQPLFNECIIDVLTGSSSSDIRCYMENFLLKLSSLEHSFKEYLLSVLIKARLPLWVNSTCVRESLKPLIANSTQYFGLRGALLENLSLNEQQLFGISASKMIQDEINWLNNFSPTKSLKEIDCVLVSGHLRLFKCLLTSEGVDKSQFGQLVIPHLIKVYLFPASCSLLNPSNEDLNMEPLCSNETSTQAAFNLLTELSRNCKENFSFMSNTLVQLHFRGNSSIEWNYIPQVIPRAECGYVGLKNGGATCYMNAVLQQLFMMPGLSEFILSVEDDTSDKQKSLFTQLQNLFAYLKESKLEYYVPDGFWKAFRMIGQEVNIREQQDAFDFFMSLSDQIDESLRKQKKLEIFKRYFEGTLANQFICKDCPHKYEREEVFFGLNLDVKSGTLKNSFGQFVKDELLDGDNSYNCEKCNEKRSAIKRTLLKKLPLYMCIQLKRFDYDWELNRSLKFDDYFEFPRLIDVKPFTATFLSDENEDGLGAIDETKINTLLNKKQEILYELAGVVVHSGSANAGHYYSFIKTTDDKWLKFNDTLVDELEFSDIVMADECFGGRFTDTASSKLFPEERVRYWNAYILFYKIKNESSLSSQSKTRAKKSSKPNKYGHRDSLSELADLVTEGDEKGLFSTCLPPSIEQSVKAENLEFCRNREIYNFDYFNFIFNLCSTTSTCCESTRFTLEFVFNVLFKTGKKFRLDLSKWSNLIFEQLESFKEASTVMLNFMLSIDIKNYLLDCPISEVREATGTILEKCLSNVINDPSNVNKILISIVQLLDKHVADLVKNSNEYFHFLFAFASNSKETCKLLMGVSLFTKLMIFLLGSPATLKTDENSITRRWNQIQTRDFSSIYELISTLVLKYNVLSMRTCEPSSPNSKVQFDRINEQDLFREIPADIKIYLYGTLSHRFLREVISAFEEIDWVNVPKTLEMLLTCSFLNEKFSANLINLILTHIGNPSTGEIKNSLVLLQNLLLIEDEYQVARLKLTLDGYKEIDDTRVRNGLLQIIAQNQLNDAKKSYQCVKFIVLIATKSNECKEFLLKNATNWEWAVNWLKSKMGDSSVAPQATSSFYTWNLKNESNESTETKTFQRTKSAQRTLDDATALLKSNELGELEFDK